MVFGLAKGRLCLAELPAHHRAFHLLQDHELLHPGLVGDERIEKLGLQTSHLAALDDEEHVTLFHGVAQVLLHPPDAPRHAGRELCDMSLVVVHDAAGHQFTHHWPFLDRHQFDAGAFHRLL